MARRCRFVHSFRESATLEEKGMSNAEEYPANLNEQEIFIVVPCSGTWALGSGAIGRFEAFNQLGDG